MNRAKALLFFAILVWGSSVSSAQIPSLWLDSVPVIGDSLANHRLRGRMLGLPPDSYRVVAYAKVADEYWIKPTYPVLTTINADGSWEINVGTYPNDIWATDYAVYLVPASYSCCVPMHVLYGYTDEIPEAIAGVAHNRETLRQVTFSGSNWSVKKSYGLLISPGYNFFDDTTASVWLDSSGFCHLALASHDAGSSASVEIINDQAYGFGKYLISTHGRIDQIPAPIMFGIFTWDQTGGRYSWRELDFEWSTFLPGEFGGAGNAQFVLQPWTTHMPVRSQLALTDAECDVTHLLDWQPDRVKFSIYRGRYETPDIPADKLMATWETSTDIPTATGDARVRINLWAKNGNNYSNQEVIITGFHFFGQSAVTDWHLYQ